MEIEPGQKSPLGNFVSDSSEDEATHVSNGVENVMNELLPEVNDEVEIEPRQKNPHRLRHFLSDSSDDEQYHVTSQRSVNTLHAEADAPSTLMQQPIKEFQSKEKPTMKDSRGNEHITFSRTGPGFVFLASSQLSPSTCQAHCEDIKTIMAKNPQYLKPVLMIISDDGDDYSQRNTTTVHSFGRLWEDLNLEALYLIKYAPASSRFNPIERAWSSMTKLLSNVILDPLSRIIKKGGSTKAKPSEKIDKDVLREYQEDLLGILKDFEYDSYPWEFGTVDPETQERNLKGFMRTPEHTDQEQLRQFFLKKQSIKNRPSFLLESEKNIFSAAKYYKSHVEICNHGISFQRCLDKKCLKCVKKHKKYPVPENFFEQLGLPTKEKNGTHFYVPEKQEDNPDHYKTFLEMQQMLKENPKKKFIRDSDLENKGHSICTNGCLITFKSQVKITSF